MNTPFTCGDDAGVGVDMEGDRLGNGHHDGGYNQAAINSTETGKPEPGSYIVDKIHASYQRVIEKHRRLEFTLGWEPGHGGIPENERADKEAKKAA
jgi:ribonuclease HI